MRIGFFTDTYFPQVSGVATSIRTLKQELEKQGHVVYIFTTTDPRAENETEERVIRLPSVPFISFKERRIIIRGMVETYRIANELKLQLIHNHTEFGAGLLGQMVARRLKIPVVHTWHTDYEKYLHYIAKGKVLRPVHVKLFAKFLFEKVDGLICPSQLTKDLLRNYGVKVPMQVIPTGIDIHQFFRSEITEEDCCRLRQDLGIGEQEIVLLTVGRLSYEKNIQSLLLGMPRVLEVIPQTHLVILGEGPAHEKLEEQARKLGIFERVHFVGMVENENVAHYYHAADYLVSASMSETQGLTYIEALASGLQSVVHGNEYLAELLDEESLGCLYYGEEAFAEALIGYIRKNLEMDEEVLRRKLYEISSEHFGLNVMEFYFETLIYFSRKQLAKKRSAGVKGFGKKLLRLKRFRKSHSNVDV